MTRNDAAAAPSLAVVCACALCLVVLPLRSQAAGSDEAGARVLFAEGRKLAATGNYAAACPKFEDSFRLDPGIGTNFNWADCLEHIGRPASAWARFLDVAAGTKAAGQVERERVARARAAALEPKLARLVVEVSTPVSGLAVERDGVALGPASWGVAIPVDPGDHMVEATAPGKKRWSQRATVPDAASTVSVTVPALETLTPSRAPTAIQTETPPASQLSATLVTPVAPARRASTAVVVLGALGGVALATSAVLALKVRSENAQAEALCTTNDTCGTAGEKARHDALVSDAYRDRNLAVISAGIGGAALLAAVYLWWRPVPSGSTAARASGLSVLPMAGSLGAHLEVAW